MWKQQGYHGSFDVDFSPGARGPLDLVTFPDLGEFGIPFWCSQAYPDGNPGIQWYWYSESENKYADEKDELVNSFKRLRSQVGKVR